MNNQNAVKYRLNVLKSCRKCNGRYIPALDGLRGIAALLVVLTHLPDRGWWFGGGFIGVDIFFVLSGYLICGLLLHEWEKTGYISLSRFYMRRFLRLMPALWTMVLVVLVIQWLRDADAMQHAVRGAIWTILYLVNWVRALKIESLFWLFDHTWSLAVEEQFYLLWPALLCFLVRRGGARCVFQVALVLALLSWAWRVGLQWTGTGQNRLYHGLDTRFDAPMWGCALAAWLHGKGAITKPATQQLVRFGAVVALAVLLYAGIVMNISLWTSKGFYSWGSVAVAWLAALLIFDATRNPRSFLRPLFCWPPLVQFGVVSYGVYLWHILAKYLAQWAQASALVEQMATIVGGTAIAMLSFYIVERPFLRLKKRFEVR